MGTSIIDLVHEADATATYVVRCFRRLTGREEEDERQTVVGRRLALQRADDIESRRPDCFCRADAVAAALPPPGTVAISATDLRVALKYALAATQLDRSTPDETHALSRLAVAIGFPKEWLGDPLPEDS